MPSGAMAGFPYSEPSRPHNFGSRCRLAPVQNPFSNDAFVSTTDAVPPPPPVAAQFFYSSPIPIDDPLSAISATNDPKSLRATLQPFSPGDNNALEAAWLGLATDQYSRNHDQARRRRSPSPSLAKENAVKVASITRHLAVRHVEKHARDSAKRDSIPLFDGIPPVIDTDAIPLCCPDLLVDVGLALRNSFCAVARKRQHTLDPETVAQAVMAEMQTVRTDSFPLITEQRGRSSTTTSTSFNIPISEKMRPKHGSLGSAHDTSESSSLEQLGSVKVQSQSLGHPKHKPTVAIPTKSSLADDGISGKPFIRVGTPETPMFTQPSSLSKAISQLPTPTRVEGQKTRPSSPERSHSSRPQDKQAGKSSVDVLVGVSRLHEVSLPALQMKPIYWSPVGDIATVLRATWFYRDDMRPINPSVANQLEAGYQELKPHAETWKDELRCAVEVGPFGEEKVSHPLWPKLPEPSNEETGDITDPLLPSDPFCAARCFHGEVAAEGTLIPSANEDNSSPIQTHRKFDHYHVIYKDEKNAFLLKPSLKPSAYYGRRPVAKIVRGITVGIPVVRGFDYEVWKSKHQKKRTQQQVTSQGQQRPAKYHGDDQRSEICPACKAEQDRSQVTDLVLVVHGIGQKLAERVENYHFTHAINAFRRAINVELNNDAVKCVLRDEQSGIMVLPINWRQDLSCEDGGPMREEDKANHPVEAFGLKDIEPRTIPAVRSMISDVMFDIPFYMSQHKPKMVAAVVREANRVYRLWCRNNPGFSERGRVHLIGHSLGTVMSVEVLSRQPTSVPRLQFDEPLQAQFFEFDTKNLFLLGSPVAFFLLLERGALLPRRGRLKPGADTTDVKSDDVVGDAGTFGCLAVDNIYNILAREDPVAYLLNGTIDPMFASSLKTAYVPSVSPSFLQSVGNAVWGVVPGASSASTSVTHPDSVKPPTRRLPSQLELEVHDFTREEIAERKALLLNDNGQVDYFLRSGGGPLELQYLNMLSAHTSYWANHDLIRMLCQEIGRKPGRGNTLPALRAMKATKRGPAPSA